MRSNFTGGSRTTTVKRRFFMIGLALLIEVAAAAPPDTDPPLDMLEFLGTWQTPDGKAMSPFDLEEEFEERSKGEPKGPSSEKSGNRRDDGPAVGARDGQGAGGSDRTRERPIR